MAAFNLLSYPACLSTPARLPADTNDSSYLPFMMFLIEYLRPKVFVELGAEDGASYCACCQIIKTLNLTTHCYGFYALEQDDKPGAQVFTELKQYHDSLYQRFSKLTRMTFDAALMDFENGTIDLLYIRAARSYEAVKHLYHDWLPKMSDQGSIIFHHTMNCQLSDGVGRLWQEIKSVLPHFELPYENGLGIISVSDNESSPLLDLARLSKEDTSQLILFFHELGQRLNIHMEREQQIERLILETEKKNVELQLLSSQLTNSLKNLEAVTQTWEMNYRAVLRKWGAKQKEMIEDKARAIQSLSATLIRERERRQQLLTELQATSNDLMVTGARLDSILGSRAWRWVMRYGRLKVFLLASINRLINRKV